MYTLGINAVFHDSSACLVKDGQVLAAAEEERFTGIKHAKRPIPFSAYELPFNAIAFCLKRAGITLGDVHHIGYSFDPHILLNGHSHDAFLTLPLKPSEAPKQNGWENPWDPLFLSYVVNAPRHLVDGVPLHLKEHFAGATHLGPYQWHFVDHHVAHAASAYMAAPFKDAAVLTLDGRGEKATTTFNRADDASLTRLGEVQVPHSLGLLYEQTTSYLGFLHSSDEYKVMALASYGHPAFVKDFREMVRVLPNGRYETPPPHFEERFGPARKPGEEFGKKHFDLARSLQVVLEEAVLEITQWLHKEAKSDTLCMAGGVALNCVMNARIRDRGSFKNVWVQPAAGDAGTALGAALWVDAQERKAPRSFAMDHAYLGPSYSDNEIEEFLKWTRTPYRKPDNLAEETARILAGDGIIGWFQGAMEFGPRSLGARSILGSPINPEMQARLNQIKDREDFRPVAPVVLEEEAHNWFENAQRSPFMLFVFDVKPEAAAKVPSVRHVDGTARVQTVRPNDNPRLHEVLKAFHARTGVPVLVNTSFNIRGKPIVCRPRDAVEAFWSSPLDALVIGPFIIEKKGAVKEAA